MNFRTKSSVPSNVLISNQYYPANSNPPYSTARSPIKSTDPLGYPSRYSESSYRPVAATENKSKASFSLTTFPTIPILREASAPIYNSASNGDQQKQKFRQVSESLAQLKRRLQGIIIEKNQDTANHSVVESLNKSVDKLYSPSQRLDDIETSAGLHHRPQIEKLSLRRQNMEQASPSIDSQRLSHAKRLPTQPDYKYKTRNINMNGECSEPQNTYIFTSPEKYSATQNSADKYQKSGSHQMKSAESTLSSDRNFEFEQEKRELIQKIEEAKKEKESLYFQKQRIRQMLNIQQANNLNLQTKYAEVCGQLEECKKKECMFREKVSALERQIIYVRSKSHNNFEDVLKDQMSETNKIKQTIEEKNDQITRLNETILLNRRTTEEAINDARIEKLKFIAEKKQLEQLHEIAMLERQNEIKTLRHALETMEAKLQVAVRENKSKDEFMQQYLVGRVKTGEEKEHVRKVLGSYVIDFPTNKLKDKLVQEQEQIERLKQLLREVKAK